MSAINVLNAMKSRIKEIVSKLPLQTEYNDQTPFNVYRQVLPERMNDDFDYSDESDGRNLYPFAVVQIAEGEKEENEDHMSTRMMILIGVHNEKLDAEGYDDVIVVIDAIMNDLNVKPYVDQRFILSGAIKWSLHEENTHPFYFGGIEINLLSASLTSNRGGMLDD